MIVNLPSQQEVSKSSPRYSYPVNKRGVRGTGNPFLPGEVKLMELAGGQADVEPIWQPILVGLPAGGTFLPSRKILFLVFTAHWISGMESVVL